jgi:hypothetical protein
VKLCLRLPSLGNYGVLAWDKVVVAFDWPARILDSVVLPYQDSASQRQEAFFARAVHDDDGRPVQGTCSDTISSTHIMSQPSLAPFVSKRPFLSRLLTPFANWYVNAAGYRKLGLR